MTRLAALLFLAALSPTLAWSPHAAAQASGPVATLSAAQAERNSVDLKQGMSLEEVQRLLGKPRRTALKTSGGSATTPGILQWTYSWPGASSSQGSLHVVFGATTAEKWLVNSWEWSSY
jgi:aryl-alcohol dehydrogenase-like predicted oxidoreductase